MLPASCSCILVVTQGQLHTPSPLTYKFFMCFKLYGHLSIYIHRCMFVCQIFEIFSTLQFSLDQRYKIILVTARKLSLSCRVIVCNRWLYMDTSTLRKLFGSAIPIYIPIWLVRRFARKMVHYSGMGRHSPEEVQHIGRQDLKALRTLLGMKSAYSLSTKKIRPWIRGASRNCS